MNTSTGNILDLVSSSRTSNGYLSGPPSQQSETALNQTATERFLGLSEDPSSRYAQVAALPLSLTQ